MRVFLVTLFLFFMPFSLAYADRFGMEDHDYYYSSGSSGGGLGGFLFVILAVIGIAAFMYAVIKITDKLKGGVISFHIIVYGGVLLLIGFMMFLKSQGIIN